jgi:hypothetical protein
VSWWISIDPLIWTAPTSATIAMSVTMALGGLTHRGSGHGCGWGASRDGSMPVRICRSARLARAPDLRKRKIQPGE